MTAIDWLIVLVLNAAVIGVGFVVARGTRSSSEWFLAGRTLPWWAVGLSMFATNVDNADLVSLAGTTYREGVHIVTVHALGSVTGGILAAFCLAPAMLRLGLYTNAEYLEARFGVSARVLSALIQIQYRTSMLGLIIWAVHLLLTSALVGLDAATSWTLVVAMVLLAALYTAWGGLRSVVWTDALQGVVMMVGAAVILVAVWAAVGGWDGVRARLEAEGAERLTHISGYAGRDGTTPAWVVVLGWTIVGGGYWTVNHTQTMRLGGARSEWDMKVGALFGVVLSLPIMLGCALLGLFGRALHPDLAEPDGVYPLLASSYLGPGLTGLVVAGVVAAAVSTFDSMGSALSAVFTRDVWARLVARDRPDAHYVLVGRVATVSILAIGFLYIPFIRSKRTMLQAFLTLIPVFVTPLFCLYVVGLFTRAHRRSGVVGLVVGSLYGVVALWDREVGVAWLPSWLTERSAALGWSLLITAMAMGVTTAVLGREQRDKERPIDSSSAHWLDRSRAEAPPPRAHPFRGDVPRALDPRLWALVSLTLAAWVVFGLLW